MLEYCRIVAGIELNIVLGVERGRLGKCSFFLNIVERVNNFVEDCICESSTVSLILAMTWSHMYYLSDTAMLSLHIVVVDIKGVMCDVTKLGGGVGDLLTK